MAESKIKSPYLNEIVIQSGASVEVTRRYGFIYVARQNPSAPNLNVNALYSVNSATDTVSKIVDDGNTKNAVSITYAGNNKWSISNTHSIAVYVYLL